MQPSTGPKRFIESDNKTYFQLVRTELHAVLRGGSAVTIGEVENDTCGQ